MTLEEVSKVRCSAFFFLHYWGPVFLNDRNKNELYRNKCISNDAEVTLSMRKIWCESEKNRIVIINNSVAQNEVINVVIIIQTRSVASKAIWIWHFDSACCTDWNINGKIILKAPKSSGFLESYYFLLTIRRNVRRARAIRKWTNVPDVLHVDKQHDCQLGYRLK